MPEEIMSGTSTVLDDGQLFCVVCGMGSHRTDWIKKGPGWVACDGHSNAEINAALKPVKSEPAPAPPQSDPNPVVTPAVPTK